jgi:hypothetical protein
MNLLLPCLGALSWSLLAAGAGPQDPAQVVRSPDPAAFAAARGDYEAGRYAAAHERFAAQLAAAGEQAPSALRWNAALAALRVLRSADAEAAIAPWLQADEPAVRADAEFVLGLASCQRAEHAAAAAQLPSAEPMAWQLSISAQERGIAAFVRALQLRQEWPEAVRNIERAQRRLLELQQLRERSQPEAAKQEPIDQPPPPPGPEAEARTEEQLPEAVTAPLSAAEVAQLQQKLRKKQQQRNQLRQQQQRAGASAGERDW